ncbi:MAG: thiamine ABC transporter ATP-binding protein [Paracoccaceae bacterium]
MLRLDDLTLARGDWSLRADAAFAPGITAVMGPSGSGKSSVLDAVAGFLAPARGRILWEGARIDALPPEARPVATLFQDGNLFAHLSLAANVALGVAPVLRPGAQALAQAREVLGEVGLAAQTERRPAELSGGQRSRAALARALVQDRPVVLLDEAFGALGPGLRDEMLALTRELLAGRTILMVTHDPGDARRAADAVAAIDGGRLLAPVPTSAFFADPPGEMARYLGRG